MNANTPESNTPETQSFPIGEPINDGPANDGPANDGPANDGPAKGNVSKPARPKGPNTSAIVLGLVAMGFAAAIITSESRNLSIDWSRTGPAAIVGIGILLVVLGAIGLVRRRDDA